MPSESKKWTVAILIAVALTIGCAGYVSITGANIFSLQGWSFISAAVASFMLALALGSGSVSYYFGWPNMRLGYQKQIGVLAFWVAIAYSVSLVILYPETYWTGFKDNFMTADILLGSLAMLIFAIMVLINSKTIAPHFSLEQIKFMLGLGYVGYALLVIRAILLEWDLWEVWFKTLDGYPPGRLILSLVAVGVLILRISVPIHKAIVKSK